MRIVCTSDTHEMHERMPPVPEGDVFVHAGDATWKGDLDAVRAFAAWCGSLPHKDKIFVAGNHDFCFERGPRAEAIAALAAHGVRYLEGEAAHVGGRLFYGSPYSVRFGNWAFMGNPSALAARWAAIPEETEVLIVHGPPKNILDLTLDGMCAGCPALRRRLPSLRKLKLFVCGHIHEARGERKIPFGDRLVQFANVAACNRAYEPVHEAQVFDL